MTPDSETLDRALYIMEKAYKPCVWILPNEYLSFAAFKRAVSRLEMNSSPGIPYQYEASTNRLWLKFNGFESCEIQLERLWVDVQAVINDDWDHYLRTFIKLEPHKKTKALEGRWRLIMAASLPVQVLWHMLFDYQNDLEIENSLQIPSQQGIVLVNGDWERYYRSWIFNGTTQGLDKSAWDWTTPYWAIDFDLQFRYSLGRGKEMESWLKLATQLYRHMFVDPKIVTSDGTVYQQTEPGIMKSGCVNTISTNSHCQILLHIVACLHTGADIYPLPIACGDDTLQHPKHRCNIEAYGKYGVVVKSVSDAIEFVGHGFAREGPYPLYLEKHIKNFMYARPEDSAQILDSMARMYANTKKIHLWIQMANAMGSPLPLSSRSYRHWYNYGDAVN